MRVLLINQYYSPDTAATAQLLRDLALGLVKNAHEVHVLCSRCKYGGGEMELSVSDFHAGVHVHRLRATGFGRHSTIGRLIDWMSFYISAMCRAMLLPKMDVSVCLTTPPLIGVVGLLLRITKGTKLIVWSMDMYPEIAVACGYLKRRSLMGWIAASVNRRLYRTASCVVSLGERMTEQLIKAGAHSDKIAIVHNWAPGMEFAIVAPVMPLEKTVLACQQDESAAESTCDDVGVVPGLVANVDAVSTPTKQARQDSLDFAYD